MTDSALTTTPFLLGEWLIERDLNQLTRNGVCVRLEPKAMEVLCALAARANVTVSRDELLHEVWRGRVVVDEVLSRCVAQLRQALEDDSREPRYIQTVPKRGYRLLVTPEKPISAAPPPAPTSTPPNTSRRIAPMIWTTIAAASVLFVCAVIGWRYLAVDPEIDADAQRLYVEGRHFWRQRTGDSLQRAAQRFEGAVRIAPAYAEAYAALAETQLLRSYYGRQLSPPAAAELARSAAQRALELNPRLSAPHAVLAVIHMQYDWNWPHAEQRFEWALALDPRNATTHQWYGELLQWTGRFDKAREQFRLALELDPTSLIVRTSIAGPDQWSGRLAAAEATLRSVLEFDPGFVHARSNLGLVLEARGDLNGAIEQFTRVQAMLDADSPFASLAHAYALVGREGEAREMLARMYAQASKGGYVSPFSIAIVHAGLGEKNEALAALERAVVTRDDHLVGLAVEPRLASLRDEPRFQRVLQQVGLLPRRELTTAALQSSALHYLFRRPAAESMEQAALSFNATLETHESALLALVHSGGGPDGLYCSRERSRHRVQRAQAHRSGVRNNQTARAAARPDSQREVLV